MPPERFRHRIGIALLRITNKYADYFYHALCAGILARRSAIRHLGDDFLQVLDLRNSFQPKALEIRRQ